MAQNFADSVIYYLVIQTMHKGYLAAIRHWSNLKVGIEGGNVWVKDFSEEQVESLEVKSIPYKHLFSSHGAKLFLLNSLLPDRNIPSILWTPIDRALPVELPNYNHNLFEVGPKVDIRLIKTDKEKCPAALLVAIRDLQHYIETSSSIRFKYLKWIMLDSEQALILGGPLLPIPGKVFWQAGDFLLPVGIDYELPVLKETLGKLLNPDADSLIIWQNDGSYIKIKKEWLRQLSISSVRLSFIN